MAEETKKTTAKKATSTKAAAPKAAKAAPKAAPKAEAEAPKAAAPKAEKKVSKGAPKGALDENRLAVKYRTEILPALVKEFGYSSVMQAPKLEKIVINVGCGDAAANSKVIEDVINDIQTITGQHPVTTKARMSIASFKVREGQPIGVKVTLRGVRMYEFFDKLVSISLPRVRDFRGVSKNAFDGHGNYTLGVKEQLIFPEIDYDKVAKLRGMDVVIVTTANSDKEAYSLLEKLGMPFRK